MTAPTRPKLSTGRVAKPYVEASSPSRPAIPAGRLPRADADITSIEPRATEWPAGANPSWRNTSTAIPGTAHATAEVRERTPARDLAASARAKMAAATIHTQALVEVTQASAASRAAIFIRPLVAATAEVTRRAVNSGSTTAEPD